MSGGASDESEKNDAERFHGEIMSVGIVEVGSKMRRTFSHLARARPYIFQDGAHVNTSRIPESQSDTPCG
jgi:hypothetical protein